MSNSTLTTGAFGGFNTSSITVSGITGSSNAYTSFIGSTTFSGNIGVTLPIASSLYISGPPVANTLSITNISSFRVETGNVLLCSSSGNVGIGTATPGSRLRVVATGSNSGVLVAHFSQSDFNDNGLSSSILGFSVEPGNFYKSGLSYIRTASFDRGRFSIITNNAANTANADTESLTVLTSGNVGIGITNPIALLTVGNNTSNTNPISTIVQNQYGNVEIGIANAGGSFSVSAIQGDGIIRCASGKNLMLQSGIGSASLYINSGGNVGIGTTTPGYPLEVRNNATSGNYNTAISAFTPNAPNGTVQSPISYGHSPSTRNAIETRFHFVSSGSLNNFSGFGWNGDTTTYMGLNASGNVGIGTTTPGYQLEVRRSNASACITSILESENTTLFLGTPHLNGTAMKCALIARGITSFSRSMLHFCLEDTANNGVSATIADSRMVIRWDGNVGIGTTNPSNGKLQIFGGSSQYPVSIKIDPSTHVSSRRAAMEFDDWSVGQDFNGNGTKDFYFYQYTTASTRLYIGTTGNVGIGITNPNAQLQLANTVVNRKIVLFDGVNNDHQYFGFGINSSTLRYQVGGTDADHVFFAGVNSTTSNELMRIKGNGNVGIGTTTPGYALDIISGTLNSNSPFIRIGNPSGGITNQVGIILNAFNGRTGGPSSQVICIDDSNGSGHLTFWTAPTGSATSSVERVRITNSGNVGIGTTTPTEVLSINGALTYNYRLNSSGNVLAENSSQGNQYTMNSKYITKKLRTSYANSNRAVITWSSRTSTADIQWYSVCWSPELSLFVAVATTGTGNRVMTSPDGINWTSRTSATENNWRCVCWSPELSLFVAVSSSGTGNRVMTSDIGIPNSLSTLRVNPSYMTVNNTSGNVGIGLTNPSFRLQVVSDSAAKPSTNTWTVSSDERLKTNITLANLDICYNNIKNLPLKRFTWRDDIYTTEQVADRSKLGWIAQDVELLLPKAVETLDMHGYSDCRSLNSDQIIACLYGAVQKLIGIVEDLQTRIP